MTTSPTPLSYGNEHLPRRAPSRQTTRNNPTRPNLKRGSPLSTVTVANGSHVTAAGQNSMADSSDDEGSAPLLSAEAEEILGTMGSSLDKVLRQGENSLLNSGALPSPRNNPSRQTSPRSLQPTLAQRTTSPSSIRSKSPRIVRLSTGSVGSVTIRRTMSSNAQSSKTPLSAQEPPNLITPAPQPRKADTEDKAYDSIGSLQGSWRATSPKHISNYAVSASQNLNPTSSAQEVQETAVKIGSLTINRSKGEDPGLHGSLRVKRVGSVGGRYLRGPARRGIIRRHSEEDQIPVEGIDSVPDGPQSITSASRENEQRRPDEPLQNAHKRPESRIETPIYQDDHHMPSRSLASGSIGKPLPSSKDPHIPSGLSTKAPALRSVSVSNRSSGSSEKKPQPVFKVLPLPTLPSHYDQENEPPPTFKRNKVNGMDLMDKPKKFSVMMDNRLETNTPATLSPPRKVLASLSQNTPMRMAPPPPKMTVLETATSTGGAASTIQSKKKRNLISVNGKLFTRMDCIGRGGSARVYRVMAENYKVFALKRVSLEHVDELAIRGFKGEIDLLRKLEEVDRVVRLFDWEVNDDKQTLSVLMEMGESDLNRVLTFRQNAENAKFDISFTRYFWKEMVECVQAVHQYDIVHSDLKPANFLLVQGRLKLIDFGIANAIQDDTVNVHREQHIGTPNYMAPESIIDSNAISGLPSSLGKMMKVGKPSDVWSLGCILYQMVYGKPPFAHFTNQMQRIMAIPNPSYVIAFPERGLGGVSVPTGLLRTLQRCLNRDSMKRPTVEELLSEEDPFLNPDQVLQGTVRVGQEVIARLQQNIVRHIRDKGMPSEAELKSWPAKLYVGIKTAVEEGRA